MNIPATGVMFDIYILHFLNCLTFCVTFGAYNAHHELSLQNVSHVNNTKSTKERISHIIGLVTRRAAVEITTCITCFKIKTLQFSPTVFMNFGWSSQ